MSYRTVTDTLHGNGNPSGAGSAVLPYGGKLVSQTCNLLSTDTLACMHLAMPAVAVTRNQAIMLCQICTGVFSPVNRLMDLDESKSVITRGKLASGMEWGEVMTVTVSKEQISGDIQPEFVLLKHEGVPLAIVKCDGLYEISELQALTTGDNPCCYGFNEHDADAGDLCLAGKVWALLPEEKIIEIYGVLPPARTVINPENDNVAIFGMTPWDRGSEYTLKSDIEHYDKVILFRENRLPGNHSINHKSIKQAGDLILQSCLSSEHLIQMEGVVPDLRATRQSLVTRMVMSQNYGCRYTRFVSQNSAEASKLRNLAGTIDGSGAWITRTRLTDDTYYCEHCESVVTRRVCPHDADSHNTIDEERLADILSHGKMLPSYVARPQISRMLAKGSRTPVASDASHYIFPHQSSVSASTRSLSSGHQSAVLWMTGLSGSGKSTIANLVEKQLLLTGHRICILDGDCLRDGLCSDLGFSDEERQENIRRAGETAKLMCDAGMIVVASFISPFRRERESLRKRIGKRFYEIYVNADLGTCEQRDPKGLYRRARDGQIRDFTGISSPYEVPVSADVIVNSAHLAPEKCAEQIISFLLSRGLLRNGVDRIIRHKSTPVSTVKLNS